ncbi:hypothetical protein [Amycolatopsis sp. cmx-4-61]|jgi:hypothetical protein|uniref:hypothetical protein n=1 Tax=Amycolatopsis sp. cmx-4-61 TaxID=2790937 RepID=UPI00397A6B34
MCDKSGYAYRTEPNTAPARAEEMCSNLPRSLKDVGWVARTTAPIRTSSRGNYP